MPELKSIIYISIALAVLYILTATVILPQFATTYEYGFGSAPCNKDGTCTSAGLTNINNGYCSTPSATVIACATCNATAGYSTFLSSCSSLIGSMNGTHCYGCSSFGFKQTSIGLMLFILVIALLSFGIMFVKYIKR